MAIQQQQSYPIGKYFSDALEVTLSQFIPIVLGALLGSIVVVVTLGLFAMTVAAGIEEMYLRARRKQPVEVLDVFRYTHKFVPLLLAGIAIFVRALLVPLILTILVGLLLPTTLKLAMAVPLVLFTIVYGAAAGCWYMHVPLLMVDRNMGVAQAMQVSRQIVETKGGTFNHFLLLVLTGLVNSLGGAAGGLGALVTVPLTFGVMAFAYDDECNAPPSPPELSGFEGS